MTPATTERIVKQTCAYCNNSFTGRTDKKFCTNKCRSTFNNKRNQDKMKLARKIAEKLNNAQSGINDCGTITMLDGTNVGIIIILTPTT